MWSRCPTGDGGEGRRRPAAGRGTRSRAPRGTSRRPSRRPGTSAGRASAAGGSRSRGRSRRRPPRRRRPRRAGSRRPSFWASIGLVDSPPPTQRSKPGPCSGCTVPTKRHVVGLGGDVVAGVPGDRGLELARQVGERRVADVAAVDLLQRRGAVDDLVLGDAGDGGAEERPRRVAARLDAAAARRRRAGPRSSGTSSIRIQWYWMFSRSVTSAVSRAKSMPIVPSARTASRDEQPRRRSGPAA